MAALIEMTKQHPDPAQKALDDLRPKCRNCLHYAGSPAFKVEGRWATCGSKPIGRAPGDDPCPSFTFDGSAYLRLPLDLRRRLAALMYDIEASKSQNGVDPELIVMSGVITARRLRLRKLRFGGFYTFESLGKKMRGQLMNYTRNQAVLMDPETGVHYTVDPQQMVYAPRRTVGVVEESQQEQEQVAEAPAVSAAPTPEHKDASVKRVRPARPRPFSDD